MYVVTMFIVSNDVVMGSMKTRYWLRSILYVIQVNMLAIPCRVIVMTVDEAIINSAWFLKLCFELSILKHLFAKLAMITGEKIVANTNAE